MATLAIALAALLFGAAFYAANVQAGLAGTDPAFAFIAAAPAATPHGVAA